MDGQSNICRKVIFTAEAGVKLGQIAGHRCEGAPPRHPGTAGLRFHSSLRSLDREQKSAILVDKFLIYSDSRKIYVLGYWSHRPKTNAIAGIKSSEENEAIKFAK